MLDLTATNMPTTERNGSDNDKTCITYNDDDYDYNYGNNHGLCSSNLRFAFILLKVSYTFQTINTFFLSNASCSFSLFRIQGFRNHEGIAGELMDLSKFFVFFGS